MLRLSDAIRLGALLHRQCFGASCRYWEGEIVATCALTGAIDAGYRAQSRDVSVLSATCPLGCPGRLTRAALVVHLNDDHRWTREAIADHLDTLDGDAVGSIPPTKTLVRAEE
jgi:hypothetical protein